MIACLCKNIWILDASVLITSHNRTYCNILPHHFLSHPCYVIFSSCACDQIMQDCTEVWWEAVSVQTWEHCDSVLLMYWPSTESTEHVFVCMSVWVKVSLHLSFVPLSLSPSFLALVFLTDQPVDYVVLMFRCGPHQSTEASFCQVMVFLWSTSSNSLA